MPNHGCQTARVLLVAAVVLAALSGCGKPSGGSASTTDSQTTASAPTLAPSTTSPPRGVVALVVTPDALPVLSIVQRALRIADPNLQLKVTTASVDSLATIITTSHSALVVSSVQSELDTLRTAGTLYQAVAFARTKLQLVVAPTDPKNIKTLSDLARPGVRVILITPNALAGRAGAGALAASGITVSTVPAVSSPQAVIAAIGAGRADASLLEIPDVVAAGSKVRAFDLPDAENIITVYSLALVRSDSSGPLVQQTVQALTGATASSALVAANYLLP